MSRLRLSLGACSEPGLVSTGGHQGSQSIVVEISAEAAGVTVQIPMKSVVADIGAG